MTLLKHHNISALPDVLVADEDAIAREYLVSLLEEDGYRCHQTDNGRTALQWLNTIYQDQTSVLFVILIGQSTPHIFEFLKESSLFPSTQTVVVTEVSNTSTRKNFKQARARAILSRPCNIDDLLVVIQEIMSGQDDCV